MSLPDPVIIPTHPDLGRDVPDTAIVADLAYAASGLSAVDRDGRFFAGTIPAGAELRLVDLQKEALAARPDRKTGTVKVHDAPAFIGYLQKHQIVETEVWADEAAQKMVAVINAHEGASDEEPNATHSDNGAGWGDHRCELVVRKTPAWQAWAEHDKKMLGQVAFAEHIEQRLIDIVEPIGSEMLDLAQTFKASSKGEFESSQRLASGEVTLEYRETVAAKAGKKGDLTIPDTFLLGLSPFYGSAPFRVVARLRYRIADGNLYLGYVLERPEDVLLEAFNDIATAVDGGIDSPVWHGTP